MNHVKVRILEKSDPSPAFPEFKTVTEGRLVGCCILEGGMESGLPSVALLVKLPGHRDDEAVLVQTTGRIFGMMAGALKGSCQRWGVEL